MVLSGGIGGVIHLNSAITRFWSIAIRTISLTDNIFMVITIPLTMFVSVLFAICTFAIT